MPDEKFILDATAGFRMMWFDKKQKNTIYLDQRPECEPDIVGDFRDLKQFKDEAFRLIVFDPPHIITSNENLNSNMRRDFGVLRPDTWKSDLVKAFAELWRVLAPHGVLIFKWCSQYRPSSEILEALTQKPLFYQIQANMDKIAKGKKLSHVQTSWFCFMKIPDKET